MLIEESLDERRKALESFAKRFAHSKVNLVLTPV
jgi:hypothetical protein